MLLFVSFLVALTNMNIESAAVNILKRGVELDSKKRYTEALVCYQEGLQVLVDKMRGTNFYLSQGLMELFGTFLISIKHCGTLSCKTNYF